jgi:hypothetical protein
MGHLNAANEAEGYGRGFLFTPDTTALWVAKMASPLPPVATNDGTSLSLGSPQGAQPLAELLR